MVSGLEQVAQEWKDGKFNSAQDEDIHSANERRLVNNFEENTHFKFEGRNYWNGNIWEVAYWSVEE